MYVKGNTKLRDVYKANCNQTESGTREKVKEYAGEREEEAICNRSEERKKAAIDRVSGKTRKFSLRESWLNKERSGWMRRVAKISA
jgi:hypothetical protein